MATYNEIFFAEYVETPNVGLGQAPAMFRISFMLDGFSGTSTELLAYKKSPCKISKADSSNDQYTPIHATKANFSLRATSVSQAERFYVLTDRQMKVTVTMTSPAGSGYSGIVFLGWVLPTELSFDYKKAPFPVDVTAVCGLSTLKDRPLLTSDGKRLKDLVSLAEVLRTALARTDFNLNLETGLNLYETADVAAGKTVNGKANPATDTLYQTLVYAETFVKDDGTVISCYDALTKVLSTFRLRLSQLNNTWFLVCADEPAGGWDASNITGETIHTRTYTGTTLSSAPSSHQSRNLNVYAYPNTKLQVYKRNPKVGALSVKNAIRVEQNYGRYINQLGDFSHVDATGLPIGYSVNNLQVPNRFVTGSDTDADPRRLVVYGAGDEEFNSDTPSVYTHLTYLEQSRQYTKFIKRTFKGRARLTNIRAAKLIFVAVRDDGPYLNVPGEGWKKYSKLKRKQSVGHRLYNTYKDRNGHDKALPGWYDYSVDLGEIDRVKEFWVYYGVGEALDRFDDNGNYLGAETGQSGVRPMVEYQAGQLVEEYGSFKIDGAQRTIARPNQIATETAQTLTLGDAPGDASPYDRLNTLFVRHVSGSPVAAAAWYRPDANIAAGTPGSNDIGKSLLRITTEARAAQAMFPAGSFEGVLSGRLYFGLHSVLHVSDITPSAQYDPDSAIPHQITRWEWDTRECSHTVTAVEMLDNTVSLPEPLREYQTPQGLIPMDVDEQDVPLPVTLKPLRPFNDDLKNILIGLGILPTTPRLPIDIPPLFTPQDPSEPQFTATGFVGGINRGTVFSALRRTVFLSRPI